MVRIGYDQIEPEDVEMLSNLMGLTDVQVGALYYLRRRLGKSWIEKLLAEGEDEDEGPTELDTLLEEGKLHGGTLGAIQRKLGLFRRFDFLAAPGPRGRRGQDHGVPGSGASTSSWSLDATAARWKPISWWPTT